MRVTDLEKFTLEQIWRPYQYLAGINEMKRLTSLPATLDETALKLTENSEWSEHVLNRLRDIGISIPAYIQCDLAEVLRIKLDLVT